MGFRLLGLDGSEDHPQSLRYYYEQLCPFFSGCVENVQQNVQQAVIGYNAARGFPPKESVQKDGFPTKKFVVLPRMSMDGGAVPKIAGTSGQNSEFCSAMTKELARYEMGVGDTLILPQAEHGVNEVVIKSIKKFHRNVICKHISDEDMDTRAPLKYFLTATCRHTIDTNLEAYLKEEMKAPEYFDCTYDELKVHAADDDCAKELLHKLQDKTRKEHSYPRKHGFVRPKMGWLMNVFRPCKLHGEQGFVKLLFGTTAIFAIRLDAEEGAFDVGGKTLISTRILKMLQVTFKHFPMRRASKRIWKTVQEHMSDTKFSNFTWRLKSRDPVCWMNIFQEVFRAALQLPGSVHEDFRVTKNLLFLAHRLVKAHSSLMSKKHVTDQNIKLSLLTGCEISSILEQLQMKIMQNSFVYLKEGPCAVVLDTMYEGRTFVKTMETGEVRVIGRSLGPGLTSQTQWSEKNNGVTTQQTFLVNREEDKLWPALEQLENFVSCVGESAIPRNMTPPSGSARSQNRFWLEFDLNRQERRIKKLQSLEKTSPKQEAMLGRALAELTRLKSKCTLCEESVEGQQSVRVWKEHSAYAETVQIIDNWRFGALHLLMDSPLCEECVREYLCTYVVEVVLRPEVATAPSLSFVEREEIQAREVDLGRQRRNLLLAVQHDEENMELNEVVDEQFNMQEQNLPMEESENQTSINCPGKPSATVSRMASRASVMRSSLANTAPESKKKAAKPQTGKKVLAALKGNL